MLADMSHQLKRVSGADGLFVVLDVETGRSACALGLATVGFLDPAFAGPDVKRRVYAAKYGVARDLAARGVSQLFLEMDVWLVRDVAPLVSPAHDITMSMHQDNPFEMNVGFYFMRANARTVAFMDATANYLDKYVLLLPSTPPPVFPCCAAALLLLLLPYYYYYPYSSPWEPRLCTAPPTPSSLTRFPPPQVPRRSVRPEDHQLLYENVGRFRKPNPIAPSQLEDAGRLRRRQGRPERHHPRQGAAGRVERGARPRARARFGRDGHVDRVRPRPGHLAFVPVRVPLYSSSFSAAAAAAAATTPPPPPRHPPAPSPSTPPGT